MITLSEIYNFFFNYNISSETAAGLRIAVYSWYIYYWSYRFKDFLIFLNPNGLWDHDLWKEFNDKRKHAFTFINGINVLAKSFLFQKFLLLCFFIFGIFSAVGFLTNISGFLFYIVFFTLSVRVGIINGCAGDCFAKLMLFCLPLVDTGAKYSIDNLLGISSGAETVDAWSFRLVQISLATCYLFTAWQKLQDRSWKIGEAFRRSLLTKNWARLDQWFVPDFLRNIYLKIANNPTIYVFGNTAVVTGEFLVPFLYLIPELQIYGVALAIFFHLGTLAFLRLGHFAFTMILANLFFLK